MNRLYRLTFWFIFFWLYNLRIVYQKISGEESLTSLTFHRFPALKKLHEEFCFCLLNVKCNVPILQKIGISSAYYYNLWDINAVAWFRFRLIILLHKGATQKKINNLFTFTLTVRHEQPVPEVPSDPGREWEIPNTNGIVGSFEFKKINFLHFFHSFFIKQDKTKVIMSLFFMLFAK